MFEVVPSWNRTKNPSLARVTGNRVKRVQKIGFIRFEIYILAFWDLKGNNGNSYFKFGVVQS